MSAKTLAKRGGSQAPKGFFFNKSPQRQHSFFESAAPNKFFGAAETIYRKCDECSKEEQVHRKTNDATATTHTPANPHTYLNKLDGSGQSLPKDQQQFFGQRMNYDFEGVKIHTDREASDSAASLNAQAYTYKNHVVFNKNKYQPEAHQGKKLLAHELTHTIQQTQVDPLVQRQVVPHFRDCVRSVTGRDDADQILNQAMHRAREYITTALDRLLNPPVPGSVYEEALQTHFGNPINDARRLRIRRIFERILPNLVVANFICNRNRCDAGDQARWHSDDDLIHVCPSFWLIRDINCQAIILIHEAAHDAGVDAGDPAAAVEEPHTPNRGEPNYPVPGQRRVGRISRTRRMNTPDAFAFFAAHVHNGVDTPTDCFN